MEKKKRCLPSKKSCGKEAFLSGISSVQYKSCWSSREIKRFNSHSHKAPLSYWYFYFILFFLENYSTVFFFFLVFQKKILCFIFGVVFFLSSLHFLCCVFPLVRSVAWSEFAKENMSRVPTLFLVLTVCFVLFNSAKADTRDLTIFEDSGRGLISDSGKGALFKRS